MVKYALEKIIGHKNYCIFDRIIKGELTIYNHDLEIEIFCYNGIFYMYSSSYNVMNILFDQEGSRKVLHLILRGDSENEKFNVKNILEKIKGKIFLYENKFIYFSDKKIFTNNFKKVGIYKLIEEIYYLYTQEYKKEGFKLENYLFVPKR